MSNCRIYTPPFQTSYQLFTALIMKYRHRLSLFAELAFIRPDWPFKVDVSMESLEANISAIETEQRNKEPSPASMTIRDRISGLKPTLPQKQKSLKMLKLKKPKLDALGIS
ncbi:hypothetical protein PT974_09994 [Cladobotryum mycophilum]|uniref:Uncharacterized protein n=1 Tax=Cladobotryum mycophilum TaxID=491253 RepID=A0ABR0S8L9_9HYPO